MPALPSWAIDIPPVPLPASYIERRWLVDDGLPHNAVNRVVQDAAGYLWLGTGMGLTRFDGRDFKLLPLPTPPGSMSFNLRDLALESPGSLLMLPASGGILRYGGGDFSVHPASASLAGKSLVDLFVEPGGALWIGTEDQTLVRWENGTSQVFGAAQGLNRRGNRYTFAVDPEGTTWVAGGDYLGYYRGGQLHSFGGEVQSVMIAPARTGGPWVSTVQQLSKLENGQLVTLLEGPDWPPARSSVHHLFEDKVGGLWVATRRDGLFRFFAGKLHYVPTSNPLINSVTDDREGNIWVAMDGGGLDRLQPKAFVLLDHAAGLPEDISTSVCSDAHGAVWCANRNGGLVRYADGKAEVIARNPEAATFFAISVCPDHEGHVWVGTTSGLYRVSATAPYTIEKISPGLPVVRGLYCSRSGDMWAATGNGGLGYFRAGVYRELRPDSGSPDQRITSIAEDPAGHVWASTRDATLHEWTGDALVAQPAGLAPLPAGRINVLHFDAEGALWIATPQGLLLRRGTATYPFSKADGLPDDNLDQMMEDNEGRLWLNSRVGLFHVSIAELKARADGHHRPVIGTTFGKDEGLAGTTPLGGGEPMTWKADDGRLWFATHRGLVGLDTAAVSRGRTAPSLQIDEVKIDGQRLPATEKIQVPPGKHRVDFSFVALNFSAPEKVRVRHQLVGMDSDWVETSSEHTATYARLPAGHYEMRAIACNQDGNWGTIPATLVVIATAAWWQTGWMAALALVSFTALVASSVRYWSHRRLKHRLLQLEQENALERERARIARDLHDELGGSLTQIRLLAERIKRHADQPEFRNFAIQLSGRARRLGSDLESIIWTVSPKNNTWDRLASFIAQYALKFFRDTTVLCSAQGVDEIPASPLRPDEQHNLLAVTKEALNNILKHSQASRATVVLSCTAGVFTLVISDDGIGFEPGRREHAASNGLNNMKARLREIGGEIVIASNPGQGTTITVTHRIQSGGFRPGTKAANGLVSPVT